MNWRIFSLIILILSAAALPAAAKDFQKECLHSHDVVAQCFIVHGSLSSANGTPTFRIWKIGTKRVLGVFDFTMKINEDDEILPFSVRKFFESTQFGAIVDGDYMVCPLTKSEPGKMQLVCVADAAHLVAISQ